MADKRELILDLLARDKTGQGARSAAKNIGDVGDAAEKAGRKTETLGHKAKDAEDKVQDLGKEADQTGGRMTKLAAEIKVAERELDKLARKFADADDAADRLDISKSIRKLQNDLRRLNTAQKLIIPDPKPEDGRNWGRKFVSSLASGLSSAGDSIATAVGSKPGITIGIALGAAAAPVLVSTISSALSAGVGAGALGAGILLAVKRDKQIQAAGTQIGKDFAESMGASAQRYLSGPIKQALSVVDGAADRVAKRWDSVFKSLAPSVVPLTKDVVAGMERISDAVANIAEDSGPALEGLGDAFKLIADGAGDALEIISDGGPEAADNLRLVAGATADVVRYSALLLDTVGKLANNAWLTGPLLPLLRKHYKDAADGADEMKKKTEEVAPPMDNAARAARGERDALAGLASELKAQTDPVFGLIDAQDKLRDAQKDVAKATKEHGKNSQEAKDALRRLAEAAINLEGKAGALGSSFNGKLTPAMRATLRAAGLTESQVDGVAAAFRQAKRDGDRYAKTYRARIITEHINTVINRTINAAESSYEETKRKIRNGKATGGSVMAGASTWTGEFGPELATFQAPVRVMSASASRGAARQMAAPVAPSAVRLEVTGEREIVALLRRLINKYEIV